MMSAEHADKFDLLVSIKEKCKEARSQLGYSNQDIADKISEMFDCGEFSVNTVNNFFSDRSKATTIYTTGYICAVLGVSIDQFLEIEQPLIDEEQKNMSALLIELQNELKIKETQIENLNNMIKEKDTQLEKADKAVQHYRNESAGSRKMVHTWVLAAVVLLLILLIAIVAVYLFHFDFTNPDYGLFRNSLLIKAIGITPLSLQ